MPDRDSHILVGLVALELGFITRSQLMSAVKAWGKKPRVRLARVLADRKLLSAAQLRSVQHEASARAKRDGGASRSLASMKIPRELRKTLLASPRQPADVPVGEAVPEAPPPEAKYALGEELGRGGLGRVVEATDAVLGRRVALKMMLGDAPGDVIERFQWEAKITGRLEHPNIVPVHELGRLPETGEVFFSMKKIPGRDLSWQIHKGDWPLRRQVEAFRDVCRAVAYAHSKGIIHRDLKPANVMLGDFGETLVVDWGLARVLGEDEPSPGRAPRAPGSERVASSSESTHLTMEGDVLGTPSYMPPEQALGRLSQLDERSDVWSLGAILYEILTKHPPFEGGGPWDVVESVIRDPVKPPSAWAPAPPELEAICLRALSKKRESRYASAADLAREVDLWLEGTLERERRERAAAASLARARTEVERWKRLSQEAREAAHDARQRLYRVRSYEPVSVKRPFWALEAKSRTLGQDAIRAFTQAVGALSEALSSVPGHAEARALASDLYWARFLEAEEDGDQQGMLFARQMVELYHDGLHAARLSGDGTLTLRTEAWPCTCLSEPREIPACDLLATAFHPWSGRQAVGEPVPYFPDLDVPGNVHVRIHGPACRPAPLEGADVWAFRYVEEDRVEVPVTPAGEGGGPPAPPAVLDALWGDAPARPRGPGLYLGRTPLESVPWPMESRLLVIVAPGFLPARVPVCIRRQEDLKLPVTLYRAAEIPAGFMPVHGGRFIFQGDRGNPLSAPATPYTMPDFLLARFPVTAAEYCDFLNDLRRTDPAGAARHVPRRGEATDPYWPCLPDRGYVVPTAAFLATASPETRAASRRLVQADADWEENWPVAGISWPDASAYARWLSLKQGRVFHLPNDIQWEWAARGADGRVFPWGWQWDSALANSSDARRDTVSPVPVTAFPTDESPWGIRGLGGNTWTWCLNPPRRELHNFRMTRGGAFTNRDILSRSTRMQANPPTIPVYTCGARMAVAVQLPSVD